MDEHAERRFAFSGDGSITRRTFVGRAAAAGAALAAYGGLLGACGGSGTSKRLSGSAQVLVGFGTGNDPTQVPTQEALAREFQKAHPGARIEFLRIPDSDAAQRKLGLLIAAGTPPEIVLPAGIFGISLYLDQNAWLDLGPFMKDSGVSLDDFHAPARRAARAVAYYGDDSNAAVGIPSGMFSHAVGYNKDLFREAGVPEPPHEWDTPGWTYDRLLEVATALTRDKRGRTPDKPGFDAGSIVQFGLGHWDTGIMLYGFGARSYDPATRRVRFDTPEYVAGTQFGVDLVNRHHVLATDELAAGVASGASDPQLGAWQRGKIAMVDMCTCDLPSFGAVQRFDWDVAAWPRGPKRLASTLNLDVGAIVARSRNHELSWQILRELLTVPASERRLATRGYGAIPPLKSQSAAFVPYVKRRYPGIDLQVFLDGIEHGTAESEAWYPAFAQVGDLGGQFLQPVFEGKAPAAAQLSKYQVAAQGKVDAWLREHKLPRAG